MRTKAFSAPPSSSSVMTITSEFSVRSIEGTWRALEGGCGENVFEPVTGLTRGA